MKIGTFTLNGVTIKTPQQLVVQQKVERQRVILLNGKPKERIKRVYRVATLSFRRIKNEDVQVIIQETLKKAINENKTTVELQFVGLSGEMETMTAIFSDITGTLIAESVMNDRWEGIDDIVFEEV